MTDDAFGLGDPGTVRGAWSGVAVLWSDTVDHARKLPDATLHQRVNNEWSFVETLRHLIFVTDAWVRRTILSEEHAYHRLALPPDFVVDVRAWGIDIDAKPSFEEVHEARLDRMATVQRVVGNVTADSLARSCETNPAPGFPPQTTFSVEYCLDVVLREERAHHAFAVRDLAVLEGQA